MIRIGTVIPGLALLLSIAAVAAPQATVFSLKQNGAATARSGDTVRNLSPGVAIPAGYLVELTDGTMGLRLPDGTSLYFPSPSVFRVVLPEGEGTPEVVLLSGAIAVSSSDTDLVIRTAGGVVEAGSTVSAVAYAPGPSSSQGTLLVRTAEGAAKVKTVSGGVVPVGKESQAIFPAGAAPRADALKPELLTSLRSATTGDAFALRTATSIPDEFMPKAEPAEPAKPVRKGTRRGI